jgi:HEAT repeat protein
MFMFGAGAEFVRNEMRKRKYILAAVVVVVISGLMWVALREPPEPVYQGKKLSVWLWLDGYTLWSHGNSEETAIILKHDEAVDKVIHQIGTNAVPTLFRMLEATDSPVRKFEYYVQEHTHYRFNFSSPPATAQNIDAAMALGALGSEDKDVIPQLIKIYDRHRSPQSQELVAVALGRIGPAASNAVPSILRVVTNSGPSVVLWNSLDALGQIHAEPEKVVPVLVKFLKDPDANIRRRAIMAIQGFGPDGKSAVQALVVSLTDQDEYARTNAMRALKAIDPEAAAKAGVK